MAHVIGIDAKLYYDPAGVGVGTWTELTNVRDVTLNLEKSEADVTTRANNGWRAMAALLKDGSVEFEMVWDTADAGFTAIKDAYFNNSLIGLAIMDGGITTSGSQGLQANFEVMNFSRSEPLEEALKVNVTVKPGYSPSTPPEWVTISA